MKILLILLVISTLTEAYGFIKFIRRENAHLIQHFYTHLEYGFLALTFSFWQENGFVKKAIRLSIPLFMLICLLSYLDPSRFEGPQKLYSVAFLVITCDVGHPDADKYPFKIKRFDTQGLPLLDKRGSHNLCRWKPGLFCLP